MYRLACATWIILGTSNLISVVYSACAGLSEDDCDGDLSCMWAADGSCKSALPCALEATMEACQSNTWGCAWNNDTGVCALNGKVGVSSANCNAGTAKACEGTMACYWSKANQSCKRRPTIILSVADDLGWYDVGFHNPRARTPTIDRLRASGVSLERYYSARFCAPTRAMLLSGRYPWRLGLQTDANLNPAHALRCAAARGVNLLPEILKTHGGYQTHAFGKWHLGGFSKGVTPTHRGFDSFVGFYSGGINSVDVAGGFQDNRCACSGNPRGACNPYSKSVKLTCVKSSNFVNETTQGGITVVDPQELVASGSPDLFLASKIEQVILHASPQIPLFLYLAWVAPHHPVAAPKRFRTAIQRSKMKFGNDAKVLAKCGMDERITYLGMVAALDEAHRIVISALDRTNRWDDTILVFVSDNGANMAQPSLQQSAPPCRYGSNYPLRGSKYSWWEGGIRSVAFVSSPKYITPQRQGTVMNDLVSAVDWRKTLSVAAGISNWTDPKDDGEQLWSKISGLATTGDSSDGRSVLPLQVWLETSRFVILFQHQDSLWKIMAGYPSAGHGAGTTFTPFASYSNSAIDQPFELPSSEVLANLSDGLGSRYLCHPYCLLNVSEDPQELVELSATSPNVLKVGQSLISQYRNQGRRVSQTGLCDRGYYSLAAKDVTDSWSISQARTCGGFVPWLGLNGKRVNGCN